MRAESRPKPPEPKQFVDPLVITRKCIVTSEPFTVTVERSDYDNWQHGKGCSPTNFPYLSEKEQDFLLSQLSPAGYAVLFRESEGEGFDGEDDGDE